jgi:long-chain acyl-CoA synthetase
MTGTDAHTMTEPAVECHPAAVVAAARRDPDRVALRHKVDGRWTDWDRRTLVGVVAAAATSLRDRGLDIGDRVGIFAPSGSAWYVAALATQSIGGVVVGAYPTSAVPQLRYLFDHAGVRFVFAGNAELAAKVHEARPDLDAEHVIVFDPSGLDEDGRARVTAWDDLVGAQVDGDPIDVLDEITAKLAPGDLCTIVYTSGTTGDPKGAMHSYRTIGQVSYTVAPALGYNEDDDYLVYLPMNHTAEQANALVCGSALGWTLNFGSLETLTDDLLAVRPTVMFAVPRVIEKLRELLDRQPDDLDGRERLRSIGLDRIRILLAGGAPLASEVLSYFAQYGLLIRNGYGMTEGGGICMPWETPPRTDTVGTPLPGVDIKLADDGEILIRSAGLCLGYYRDPEASAALFDPDGFLFTGDLGEWSDGELRIVDRKKDILITRGGKNIAPSPIEHMLKESPYVNQAIVVGDDRPYLVALIEATPVSGEGDVDLQAAVQAHVDAVNARVSKPEQIKRFALLPRALAPTDPELTPTMKVKRDAFTRRYRELIDELYG